DGTTGQGRVWRISPDGTPTEVFRIQPMANEVTTPSGVTNVGRDVRSLPPGTITVTATSRNASNTAGSQALVANGLAFDHAHNLYIADTARGALWRVHVENDSTPDISTGCDETFAADTLCLSHVWFANPMLEGVDGGRDRGRGAAQGQDFLPGPAGHHPGNAPPGPIGPALQALVGKGFLLRCDKLCRGAANISLNSLDFTCGRRKIGFVQRSNTAAKPDPTRT